MLKKYGIFVSSILVILALLLSVNSNRSKISTLNEDISQLEKDISKLKQTEVEEVDPEEYEELVVERLITAHEIGKELIDNDLILTEFFKTAEPLPEDEDEKNKLLERVDKAKRKNQALTGASDGEHINTLRLNPEWDMKLESVAVYNNVDKIPVVFSMQTKDKKEAGLIYAVYDVNNHMIVNISRVYTNAGRQDESDVGGM